jgi:hypothetical protein
MKTLSLGLLLVVILYGCSSSNMETHATTSSPKSIPMSQNIRSTTDVTYRLRAANLQVSDETKVAMDQMAPFGIEHTLTIVNVEGLDLAIYRFGDVRQAERAKAKLPSLGLDVDYVQLDNLLIMATKSEQAARILRALG